MRRETKIGLLAIFTLAVGVWGFKYLMGVNVLESSTILYSKYEDVNTLRLSTPIYYKGYQIGLVSDLYPDKEDISGKIIVEFNINEGVKIHKDAIFQITSTSVMGDQAIMVFDNPPCEGDMCAKSNDFVRGEMRGLLGSMIGTDDLESYMKVLGEELKNLFKTITEQVDEGGPIGETLADLRASMANFKSLTGRLDGLLAQSSSSISGTFANLESLTDTLTEASGEIKVILGNAEKFSKNLKDSDIQGTLEEAKTTFSQLQGTLESADGMVANLNAMILKIKDSEGAIGMLLDDKKFAESLQITVKDLDLLLEDIRLHPERYRRILSKKKMPYEPPEEKDKN